MGKTVVIILMIMDVYNTLPFSWSVLAMKKYLPVAPVIPIPSITVIKKLNVPKLSNMPYSAGLNALV